MKNHSMSASFRNILWAAVIFSLLILPFLVFAQDGPPDIGGNRPDTGGNIPGAGLKNPLKDINSLDQLIVKILDVVVRLGAYVAVIFIIWSGFLFVKAGGNETELTEAKRTFFYTIIGVAILLGAKAIALALEATIKNIAL